MIKFECEDKVEVLTEIDLYDPDDEDCVNKIDVIEVGVRGEIVGESHGTGWLPSFHIEFEDGRTVQVAMDDMNDLFSKVDSGLSTEKGVEG